jgi:TrmH family RNA methyltransferase
MLAMQGGADPFREMAVRGAAGSSFRVPIATGVSVEGLQVMQQEHGLQIVAADGRGEIDYLDVDFGKPTLLVLGGEAAGLPAEILAISDHVVRIPMSANVESLNVAVAAGVILFEAKRQRR